MKVGDFRDLRAAERPPSVFCLGESALADRVTEGLWLPSP